MKKESRGKREKVISKIFRFFRPPSGWRLPVTIMLGIAVGLLFHIISISNAPSYLSDDPRACINCHIMIPEYATWQRGSHGRNATCNDCHVPQNNIFSKYSFKAKDGMRHAFMFTFRLEPQVIMITDGGKYAVQSNCIRCHENLIHPVAMRSINAEHIAETDGRFCWDCHRHTPHGRVHSLSSTPFVHVPPLEPVMPEWMREFID